VEDETNLGAATMSMPPKFMRSTRSLMDIVGLIHWLEYIWALGSCLFFPPFFSRASEFIIIMLDSSGVICRLSFGSVIFARPHSAQF